MEELLFDMGPEDLLRFGESLLDMYRMSNQKWWLEANNQLFWTPKT